MFSFVHPGAVGRLGVALLTATLSLPVSAADAGGHLRLDDAIRLAVERGPDSAVASRRVAVQHAVRQGVAAFPANPVVLLGAGARLEDAASVGVDAQLQVRQALPIFGRWGAAIDAAEQQVHAAQVEAWAERSKVARDAALLYVAAQHAEAREHIADRRVQLLKTLVEQADRRFAAGNSSRLDVNLWNAELGRAEAQLARRRSRAQAARVWLATACGLDPAAPPTSIAPLDAKPVSEWFASTDAERADLLAHAARIDVARQQATHAERKAWPDVTVGAGIETEGARWTQGPSGEFAAGVNLSVPLAFFERNQREVLAAKANAEVRQVELSRARVLATAEIDMAKLDLAAAETAERTLRKRVHERHHENWKLLQKAYSAGKISFAELLARQRTVLDAEGVYVDALADVVRARVQLAFATGALSAKVASLSARASAGGAQ